MQYAVVDIETTGGFASGNRVTEVAIHIHDGKEIIDSYETLINPCTEIPPYIEALTGISNAMVAHAPCFHEVAEKVYTLLNERVFIAHNVNFDYSFLKHELALAGYDLQSKKLCTVRLSRKIFPGFASYSLGKLCNSLQIQLSNRHRAGGDAAATAILFGMLVQADGEGHIVKSLNKASKEQLLPPNLPRQVIDGIPEKPGVYYFKDQKGKVIYIGKAKNLKKRICSHFSGNNAGRQRQAFLRDIFHVDYHECGTELMAFILEAAEIKRLWPANNRAMKRFEQKYALITYTDQQGYYRLVLDKHQKQVPALYTFNSMADGHQLLRMLIKEHLLCEKLCFIQQKREACTGHASGTCSGACVGAESAAAYNVRVKYAIKDLQTMLPSFALIDSGRTEDEQSCVWVEEGQFYGMGYVSYHSDVNDLELLKSALTPYPSNDYIVNLVLNYAELHPHKKVQIKF